MQLLHSCSCPNAEFASFSLLLQQPDGPDADGSSWSPLADAITIPSPTATVSPRQTNLVMLELHDYLNAVFTTEPPNSFLPNKKHLPREDMVAKTMENAAFYDSVTTMYLDDRSLIDNATMQVYHPSAGHGISIHFLVIRDLLVVRPFTTMIIHQGTVKRTGNLGNARDSVSGIVLCVGVSGISYAYSCNPLMQTLAQRVHDAIGILTRLGQAAVTSKSVLTEEECRKCARSVVSTLVLTDEEERKTNAMVDAEADQNDELTEESDSKLSSSRTSVSKLTKKFTFPAERRRRSVMNTIKKRGSSEGMGMTPMSLSAPLVSTTTSALLNRKASEHMALMSVSETDAAMRRYESRVRRKGITTTKMSRTRRSRKPYGSSGANDFDQFDFVPAMEKAAGGEISGPDLVTRLPGQINTVVVPTLSAPTRDIGRGRRSSLHNNNNQGRRWTIGFDGTRTNTRVAFQNNTFGSQFASNPNQAPPSQSFFQSPTPMANPPKQRSILNDRRSSLTNFGNPRQRPAKRFVDDDDMSTKTEQWMEAGARGNRVTDEEFARAMEEQANNKSGNRTKKETKETSSFDPFNNAGISNAETEEHMDFFASSFSADRTATTASTSTFDTPSASSSQPGDADIINEMGRLPFYASTPDNGVKESFEFNHAPIMEEPINTSGDAKDFKGFQSFDQMQESSVANHSEPVRLQVNVALNEDLTCSYKQSKMASCSIEGVIQVQVKSDAPEGCPFYLLLRDPSRHIKQIQENKKYADDVSAMQTQEDADLEHRFSVNVPNSDNYFPIMRYKCSNELRPVPIRVQTRVRLHGIFCRVALQISSNPANEDDLTDLNIIMVVPPEVRGETLTTSPPGGVWNANKRSVLWCVSELGDGEKFQLQAQFEMDTPPEQALWQEREKPKFPVLVRCQCMYAQLSDIELEVLDVTEVMPADVTMKLARRFRLSHREK